MRGLASLVEFLVVSVMLGATLLMIRVLLRLVPTGKSLLSPGKSKKVIEKPVGLRKSILTPISWKPKRFFGLVFFLFVCFFFFILHSEWQGIKKKILDSQRKFIHSFVVLLGQHICPAKQPDPWQGTTKGEAISCHLTTEYQLMPLYLFL